MTDWIPQLDPLQQATLDILKTRNRTIENVCETALATGTHGVMVIEEGIDFFHVQATTEIPAGEIYRFPSRAAYAAWHQLGRP